MTRFLAVKSVLVAQPLDLAIEVARRMGVGDDAFENLNPLAQRLDFLAELAAFQRFGGIGRPWRLALVTIARLNDAADRHDDNDRYDHFKRVHASSSF